MSSKERVLKNVFLSLTILAFYFSLLQLLFYFYSRRRSGKIFNVKLTVPITT